MPPYKKHFQISLTHFSPIARKLEKMPQLNKNYHLKTICHHLKNLYSFVSNFLIPNGIEKGNYMDPCRAVVPCQNIQYSPQVWLKNQEVENS